MSDALPPTDDTTDVVVADDLTAPEGAELVAFRFDEPLKAQEAMLAASRLSGRGRLKIDDAAIVIKHTEDRVQLVQTRDTNPAQGAATGSWLGMLAGLFVPGGILIGAALGAAVGGIWAKLRDIGIDDDEMKRMGERLEVGHAALFLLVTDWHRAHVAHELARFDGTVHATTFDDDCRAWLDETLADPPYWS